MAHPTQPSSTASSSTHATDSGSTEPIPDISHEEMTGQPSSSGLNPLAASFVPSGQVVSAESQQRPTVEEAAMPQPPQSPTRENELFAIPEESGDSEDNAAGAPNVAEQLRHLLEQQQALIHIGIAIRAQMLDCQAQMSTETDPAVRAGIVERLAAATAQFSEYQEINQGLAEALEQARRESVANGGGEI